MRVQNYNGYEICYNEFQNDWYIDDGFYGDKRRCFSSMADVKKHIDDIDKANKKIPRLKCWHIDYTGIIDAEITSLDGTTEAWIVSGESKRRQKCKLSELFEMNDTNNSIVALIKKKQQESRTIFNDCETLKKDIIKCGCLTVAKIKGSK